MYYRLVIKPEQIQNSYLLLTRDQQHYLERVLRLNSGDQFLALNGTGDCWSVELRGNQGIILQPYLESTELPLKVTLLVAIPKTNAFEEMLRCCTELGVYQIIPIISQRTQVSPRAQKLERWQKIVQEAVEQSERQIVPMITPPQSFTTALKQVSLDPKPRYLCVTRQDVPNLLSCTSLDSELVIATGPEGGWTEGEIQEAIALGFQPVSLGKRILRAVTAPITALSIIAALAEP